VNKLVIPVILVGIIMVAGIFSFITVEKASAVHIFLLSGAGGGLAIVSDTVTTIAADLSNDKVRHNFVLESTKPYTIHDITVKSEIKDSTCQSDKVNVEIDAYPAEYGNYTLAVIDDREERILDAGKKEILDGTDEANPQTWSKNVEDRDNSVGRHTIQQDTIVVTQVTFTESCSDANDFSAEVTYYLSGLKATDVVLTIDKDELALHGD